MQAAELVLADSVDDSGPLSGVSSDCKDSDIDQTAINSSDSDASDAVQVASNSESEEESDAVQDSHVTSGHYPIKGPNIIWRKYHSSAAGKPKSCHIIQCTGPTNAVSEAISSPLDALN